MRDDRAPLWYPDGGLIWDDDGRIVECDAWDRIISTQGQFPHDDWRGHVVMPGFVDCHTHLPQIDCRNKTGYQLLDWLNRYIYPAEAQFADNIVARTAAQRFFSELLRHGTTTAMIFSTIHEHATHIAFEEAERAGVRAIIGKTMMDQHCPEALMEKTADSLRATESLIQRWHGRSDRLYYAVTPRFALTCSPKLLQGAGALATQAKVYFQTHMAETREEVRQAHEMHQVRDYITLWENCGCIGHRSLFAHAIYLTDDEWRRVALHDAAIAHCPSSNLFLHSGRMPYEYVAQCGVRCGLGSDVGAGPEFSLWDVIRCGMKAHTPQHFSHLDGFYRATLGGAAALGMAETIGSFHVGKQADVAVFRIPVVSDVENVVRDIATRAPPAQSQATYVNGTCSYRV